MANMLCVTCTSVERSTHPLRIAKTIQSRGVSRESCAGRDKAPRCACVPNRTASSAKTPGPLQHQDVVALEQGAEPPAFDREAARR